LKPFQEVIGIDPSSVMLDEARSSTSGTKFQFIQGSAEELSQTTVQPESVDLITAGIPPFFKKNEEELFIFFILFKRSLLIGLIGVKSGHKHIGHYVMEALLLSGYILFSSFFDVSQKNKKKNNNFRLGLRRISTHKSSHFDTSDHGIRTRQ
jgi:Methyltransferase domain